MGLVVWQAGFVLADLLLRQPPFGSWHGASVLDLGCGTGAPGARRPRAALAHRQRRGPGLLCGTAGAVQDAARAPSPPSSKQAWRGSCWRWRGLR